MRATTDGLRDYQDRLNRLHAEIHGHHSQSDFYAGEEMLALARKRGGEKLLLAELVARTVGGLVQPTLLVKVDEATVRD